MSDPSKQHDPLSISREYFLMGIDYSICPHGINVFPERDNERGMTLISLGIAGLCGCCGCTGMGFKNNRCGDCQHGA